MNRLSGENLSKFDLFSYCLLKTSTLQFCKCGISESMIGRGLKLYQLINDDFDHLVKN